MMAAPEFAVQARSHNLAHFVSSHWKGIYTYIFKKKKKQTSLCSSLLTSNTTKYSPYITAAVS